MAQHQLAAAVFAALLATLVLNVFEADLTDRFYYVPEAILIALLTRTRMDATARSDVPESSPHLVAV